MPTPKILHDEEDLRFYAKLEAEDAELTYSLTSKNELDLDYTFVPESHRNTGLAHELVHAALEHVKAKKLKFIASCPVVEAYVKRHPQYAAFMVEV